MDRTSKDFGYILGSVVYKLWILTSFVGLHEIEFANSFLPPQ